VELGGRRVVALAREALEGDVAAEHGPRVDGGAQEDGGDPEPLLPPDDDAGVGGDEGAERLDGVVGDGAVGGHDEAEPAAGEHVAADADVRQQKEHCDGPENFVVEKRLLEEGSFWRLLLGLDLDL